MTIENLAGTTAVLTGAASGIGRGTAIALGRRGVRLVLGDIDEAGVDAVAQTVRENGGQAVSMAADVTTTVAFENLRAAALSEFGRVDIVMNNVGVLTRGLPEFIPLEEWQRILDTNLLSVVRSNAVFLPLLIEQGSGHVINTASFAGLFTYAYDRMPYAASKAAVIQISEGLALYLKPKGIGVTVLCPGPVATNIGSSIRTFGPDTITRGPGAQFAVKDPSDVGELVADAVIENRFLVTTDDQVLDILRSRAANWDDYLDRQAESIASS